MAMTERVAPAAPKLSLIDRAILAIAPSWGIQRIVARRAFSASESRFARIEAAEHNDIRGERWLISRLSPDSQFEQDLETIRDRSRDIYQNDAMGGVVDGKVNHVIGTGHTPQSRIKAVEGVVSDEEAELYNKQIEATYENWNGMADRSGTKSLWQLSRLAERHNEFDGESFTVLSDVGRAEKPIPLALQVIDPVRVETPPKFAGDASVRLGIRHDENGQVVGYYVRRTHPGDTRIVGFEYDFITADRMLHVFEPWFAEQTRGLPWMTRALNRARDAKDFDEAAILGAQVEACYAGFVKPAVGTGYLSATGAASGVTTGSGRRLQDVTPGTITHLDPGEEIVFGSPQRPGNSFAPFQEWNYRRVAAAINWPYEMVVKNWNGLSFAAGRLVLTDAKKATEVGQKLMREAWFCRVWNRIVDEAVVLGETDIDPRSYLDAPYIFRRHVWIAPKWEYALNPGEEVDADISEIDANLSTLEDKLGKRGYDLEDLIERRKRENKLIDEAGLTPKPKESPFGFRRPSSTNQNETDPAEQPDAEEVPA